MEHILAFSIVLFAAVIHASFQLSVSTLTLMSGHALGRTQSRKRLVRLMRGFLAGAAMMTILLFGTSLYIVRFVMQADAIVSPIVWAAVCGMMLGLGVTVWLFYFRKDKGTTLWIPRKTADYLVDRCKKTKNSGEAFGLGMASVFGELLFIYPLIAVAVLVLVGYPIDLQLAALGVYVLVSVSLISIVAIAVSMGGSVSRIQRWREQHKRFIQFVTGTALIVFGFYLYVNEVLSLGVLYG